MRVKAARELPAGVVLRPLERHTDDRGFLVEVFRQSWLGDAGPVVQWNTVRSEAGVLRGVHVHPRHADYLVLLSGRARIGLADLRPGSPTEGLRARVELTGDALRSLFIPPGVAHGFYFHERSLHVYAVTHYWDVADELGCRFDDPSLGLEWPTASPRLSPRDACLPPLTALRGRIPAWAPGAAPASAATDAGPGAPAGAT